MEGTVISSTIGSEFADEIISANKKAEAAAAERLAAEKAHYEEEIRVLKEQVSQNMEAIASVHNKLKETEEKTHNTGVRIYRNVQAVIIDENKKQTQELTKKVEEAAKRLDDISAEISKSENLIKRSKRGLLLPVFVVLLLIANLVFSVLNFLGYTF